MIKRMMKKFAKKPVKKAPVVKKPIKKAKGKEIMEHKPKEKTSTPVKGSHRKILTAEGWRRLMMGKKK